MCIRDRFASDAGIDPYTRAVSDVYQDLFQEGSFVGKGIYAVDTFEQTLGGRFADNRILSHDLIEGCYARSGLLSDVQLFEEYPARYSADVKRRQRWIRGDWQLLPWLLPWSPKAGGGLESNRLSPLARWKILDNLRRSLEPMALLGMLLWGWLGATHPVAWTLAVLILLLVLPLSAAFRELLERPRMCPCNNTWWPPWAQPASTCAGRCCPWPGCPMRWPTAWVPWAARYGA